MMDSKKIIIATCLMAILAISIGSFLYFDRQQIRNTTVSFLRFMAGLNNGHDIIIQVQTEYYTPIMGLVMLQHHDANKSTLAFSYLENRTLGFSSNLNYGAQMIYIGWSEDTANYAPNWDGNHVSKDLNNTGGQGNGFGRKTLVVANITDWATKGKYNATAKAYALEAINGVMRVYIAIAAYGTYYNCYVAIDLTNGAVGLNFPTGGLSWIQSTFIVQFT